METFYSAWQIVQQFLAADARLPREVALPNTAHRQVARWLEERRNYPVLDIIEAMTPISQPELLQTTEKEVDLFTRSTEPSQTDAIISPIARSFE